MGDGMARNDIRFGQAGQADFSQANAMFRSCYWKEYTR